MQSLQSTSTETVIHLSKGIPFCCFFFVSHIWGKDYLSMIVTRDMSAKENVRRKF